MIAAINTKRPQTKKDSTTRKIIAWISEKADSNEAMKGISLAILVGVVAGFGAVIFRWMIAEFQDLFFGGGQHLLGFMGKYFILVIPVVGGLIVGLLIYYFAREAKGHGVPEVMEAVALRGGHIRPRVAIIKSLASSICIGSGGSVGREGPIAQIGASFGSTLGQWLKLSDEWVRTLVACGIGGGISATFNAPIGGVFFALEIILGRFVSPRFGYVVISSVVADAIGRAILGNQASFEGISYSQVSNWEFLPYALLGIIAALAAVSFNKLLYKGEDLFDALRIPEYVKPALGGIGLGLIGLYSFDALGVGYGHVYWTSTMSADNAVMGEMAIKALLIMFALKMLATSLTLGSGGSGGVFAPSLFMGSMLGGAFGTVVHSLMPGITATSGAYAIIGMAAMFAAMAKAPITAVIIIFEMTGDYKVILPLMVAVAISTAVSRGLSKESVYTLKLLRRGVNIGQLDQTSPMKEVTVAEAMTKNFPVVTPDTSVSELLNRFRRSGHHGYPVVDARESLLGMVTLSDVESALANENNEKLTVNDIYTKNLITAYPDEYIHDVFVKLDAQEVGRIPVVRRNNHRRLVGVLSRQDVLKAYSKAVSKTSHQHKSESTR